MQAQLCADHGQLSRQPVPASSALQLQDASRLCVGRTSAGPLEGQHSPATLLAAQTAAFKEGQLAEQRAYAHFLAGDQSRLLGNYHADPYAKYVAAPVTARARQQRPPMVAALHSADRYSTDHEGSQYGVGQQGLNPRYSAACFGPPQPSVYLGQAAGAPHAQGSMPMHAVGGSYHLPVHRQHTRSHELPPSPLYEPRSFAGNYLEIEHAGPDLPQQVAVSHDCLNMLHVLLHELKHLLGATHSRQSSCMLDMLVISYTHLALGPVCNSEHTNAAVCLLTQQ